MTVELTEYHYLPPGFLECNAKNLHHVLAGPSLIHLKGKRENPLFVAILQHGNEGVGLYAIQNLLKAYDIESLPRSLSIFVGNVDAAKQGMRRLDYQPDYNRMWPYPGADIVSAEAKLMQRVVDIMREKQPIASVDFHNNTGLNPHYACINKLDNKFFHLASLFSPTVVYFIQPQGVQSMAFAEFCPAVTLECGHVDDQAGVEHGFEFLDACMQLIEIPNEPVDKQQLDLYHTIAVVKVPKEFDFSFEDSTRDIYFNPILETFNFKDIEPGTLFAVTHVDKEIPLEVFNEAGEPVATELFDFTDNEIRFRKSLMPSMITMDEKVIRQDCLCYLMERYPV